MQTEVTKQLSFGEKLVGIEFNPSNDSKVHKAKSLCAELANLVAEESPIDHEEYIFRTLRDHAITELLNAQMNIVKVLTLKY